MMLLAEAGVTLSRRFLAEWGAPEGAPAEALVVLPRLALRFAV